MRGAVSHISLISSGASPNVAISERGNLPRGSLLADRARCAPDLLGDHLVVVGSEESEFLVGPRRPATRPAGERGNLQSHPLRGHSAERSADLLRNRLIVIRAEQ